MESDKNLRPKQRRFLICFEACASVTRAARWAKVARQMHYDWMEKDPEYATAFSLAEKRALRTLEDEAVRRAHEGVRKPVYYRGKIVGYTTEYSDQLLIAALKAWGPEKYRDNSTVRVGDVNGGSIVNVLRDLIMSSPDTS